MSNFVKNKKDGSRFAPKTKKVLLYATDENAIKNMASFPWNEIVGSPLNVSDGDSSPQDSSGRVDCVPGIMVLKCKPVVGSTPITSNRIKPFDTLNKSADMFFNYIGQGFTSGISFQASDLLMSVIAGANIFAELEELRRVYGMMRYFLQQNTYYAENIIEALGFNYDVMRRNLANFRSEFNIAVDEANKTVAVPKDFPIMKRWLDIFSNIYTDTSSPDFSTAIAYVSDGALKYNPTISNKGTALQWDTTPRNSSSSETGAFDRFDSCLNALDDDDVREMYAVIRRVYSDGDLYKAAYLDENYITPVSRCDTTAATIHNLTWYSSPDFSVQGLLPAANSTSLSAFYDVPLSQDGNGKLLAPVIVRANNTTAQAYIDQYASRRQLIDLYDHLADPSNVLEITSNVAPIYNTTTVAGAAAGYIAARTEVITDVVMLTADPGTSDGVKLSTIKSHFALTNSSASSLSSDFMQIALLSHVDSHPLIAIYPNTTEMSSPLCYLGEIDRYTTLSCSDVFKLQRRTAWKLLMLPPNSKSVT